MHWILWVLLCIVALYLFPVLVQLLGGMIVFMFTLAGKAIVVALFVVLGLALLWMIFGGIGWLFAWIGRMTSFFGRGR